MEVGAPDNGMSRFEWSVAAMCDGDAATIFPEIRILRNLFPVHEIHVRHLVWGIQAEGAAKRRREWAGGCSSDA